MTQIFYYDTTLRDGSQGEKISFSVKDKLNITKKLDELGIHYIEGGWPGSNPKDIQYFKEVKNLNLKKIKVAAFGSTRHNKNKVNKDPNVRELINAGTPVVTIFGKSWDLHVKDALRVSLEDNLKMIYDTVKYLKSKGREVIYDAEHFFDAFKSNREYALATVKRAEEAGADCIALCETNGGCLYFEVENIVSRVKQETNIPIGIHTHNDSDSAVANTIAAVRQGAVHIQGTMNGFGERCGNANLVSIIPNLELKMNYKGIGKKNIKNLKKTSIYVAETANVAHNHRQPFVGDSAFAHKGGIHVSAVQRNPVTYEHLKPELVGNIRRVLIGELSGKSNIDFKAKQYGIDLKDASLGKEVVKQIKKLESKGFHFEAAEASFELMLKRAAKGHKAFFNLEGFRVINEKKGSREAPYCEATIKVTVDGKEEHTAAEGNGPVNALDNALRKALEKFYPELKKTELTDFKVRVIDEGQGTDAKVRVLIEMSDKKTSWTTIGVSENIIEASWQALTDAIDYKLLKYREKKKKKK